MLQIQKFSNGDMNDLDLVFCVSSKRRMSTGNVDPKSLALPVLLTQESRMSPNIFEHSFFPKGDQFVICPSESSLQMHPSLQISSRNHT